MNRRDAVSKVAILLGTAVIGAEFFLSGCKLNSREEEEKKKLAAKDSKNKNTEVKKDTPPKKLEYTGKLFTQEEIAYLNEVSEIIIPTTDTPGAKAAEVGVFMAVMVTDSYKPVDQKIFRDGMKKIEDASTKKYKAGFMALTPVQRNELLTTIDNDMSKYEKSKAKGQATHYFMMMKQLTMLGYFTSEYGATKALRYEEVPGHYDGNLPYKKGDRAFA
ncbi:gluconate 2-dehydrogenase subunit 3 family protein [Pseudoflavitalea sp. G-6-1-2]|uniref:gluconate 2-dehydrogenase subunit 3 family protein n=1 Tax=Pseudoflavitalea sp. G-6-1-2 TaxID=2728841 RepID=UPI00146D91F0|nr:gluconate 2-dehydrogenase subunit 3 family protein [Pseudoflavitalea sp. G-6-1-2]NML19909.1 gluconate 2-dehydrogenase subunit 3 family protein [Pseudoflavitalea sp. G-6-1-2]